MKSEPLLQQPQSAVFPESVVLRRLVAEVTAPEPVRASGYNRTYNRHNR